MKEQKTDQFFSLSTLGAIGVVFGDIGTSPLYAIREIFHGHHSIPLTKENIFGVICLVLWSIVIVIGIKYQAFVMKADNKGEGGVLALMALALPKDDQKFQKWNQIILFLGLFGSALLVGDGMITPAISVLSAMEGLSLAAPILSPYILSLTLFVLSGLFFFQYKGTAKLGVIFGIIVSLWFLVIAVLGLRGIYLNPDILNAMNPLWAIRFFYEHRLISLVVLGGVFLVATGGEALYADMGHFGRKPIEQAWFFVAMPALMLNYLGQGAWLLIHPEHVEQPFYHMVPSWALSPLVLLATMATVIASQAVISGVFSLVRQSIQLGFAPRFRMIHTSEQEVGQVYLPQINWLLFFSVIWLVLQFRSSGALASAYGMAVSMTMVITTLLASVVALRFWQWPKWKLGFILCLIVPFDVLFLFANFTKVLDGGWFPLVIGSVMLLLMTTWSRGRQILYARLEEKSIPLTHFLKNLKEQSVAQVQGIAVFMTGDPRGTPPALFHNIRHNHVMHSTCVLLTIVTEDVPRVPRSERISLEQIEHSQVYRVVAHYGFAQSPSIREILFACAKKGYHWPLPQISFFLGRETLLPTDRPGMAKWREGLFVFLSKNAERATFYFDIPTDQVVEMGIQVEL